MVFTEAGYVGNVWIAQHHMPDAGMEITGHAHLHDHASLLVKGRVKVQIEGEEWTEFTAPTFIVIRANLSHRIVSLEDDTIWYCVFALRDLDGEVVSQYDEGNAPSYHGMLAQDHYRQMYERLLEDHASAMDTILRMRERMRLHGIAMTGLQYFTDGQFDRPHLPSE